MSAARRRTPVVQLGNGDSGGCVRGNVMEEAFAVLLRDVRRAELFETLLVGQSVPKARPTKCQKRSAAALTLNADIGLPPAEAAAETVRSVVGAMAEHRKRPRTVDTEALEDADLSAGARFTDAFALTPYAPFLHYVPRIVNVVTVRFACSHPVHS